MGRVACLDVGSTFTKAVLVDLGDGEVLATGATPTTLATDVLDGVDALVAELAARSGGAVDDVLACSSAGGGLRLAVVGYEREVTAEAGHRVGLSAGARVVHVTAGPMDGAAVRSLREARADVVLLVGGTDGGNADVLLHNASRLARARLAAPVVLAGNVEAHQEAATRLAATARRVVLAANVLPRIGVIQPGPARRAIREVFLRHVIGGKGLSRGARFPAMVRAPTPDAVLSGVEMLAAAAGQDVLVVDVGGATTDVYSVVRPQGEDSESAALPRAVVGPIWHARTVEGDLGVRWNAPGIIEAAMAEGLLEVGPPAHALTDWALRCAANPGLLPATPSEQRLDARLAELAVTVAMRRHGRPPDVASPPRPLRDVALVVGSGGVLRNADSGLRREVLRAATTDHGGGWIVPDRAHAAVDAESRLFAAGLLAADHPRAASAVAGSVVA